MLKRDALALGVGDDEVVRMNERLWAGLRQRLDEQPGESAHREEVREVNSGWHVPAVLRRDSDPTPLLAGFVAVVLGLLVGLVLVAAAGIPFSVALLAAALARFVARRWYSMGARRMRDQGKPQA